MLVQKNEKQRFREDQEVMTVVKKLWFCFLSGWFKCNIGVYRDKV